MVITRQGPYKLGNILMKIAAKLKVDLLNFSKKEQKNGQCKRKELMPQKLKYQIDV